MQAVPPSGGKPAPQAAPAQAQGGQGESPAGQAVQMIQKGFQTLGQMMQHAGGQIPAEDVQLFQQATKATDAFLQALTSPAQEQAPAPQPKAPGGPMAANANSNSQPLP